MNRNTIIRWVLDFCVVIALGYVGWSVRQFQRINESDIRQTAQIESIQGSIGELSYSLSKLSSSIENLALKQEALILVTTYRTDPWSGAMMDELQDGWFDIISTILPELNHGDMPNVKEIQKRLSDPMTENSPLRKPVNP